VLPLYGFLEGDALGLVILAEEHETVAALAEKLRQAAKMRVASNGPVSVWYGGQRLDPNRTLKEAGIEALQRFDVRRAVPDDV
jgi:Toluene-4-monooxygenase system protein B (TmoB)